MNSIAKIIAGVFVVSEFLISCYPETKILGRYPDGKLRAVRHYKRGDSLNERFVYYYENGKKQYERIWRGMWVYRMRNWYSDGRKREWGRMREKDTGRVYTRHDSEYVYTALQKVDVKGWYHNGKLKFELLRTKDNFVLMNYYDSTGQRIRQEFLKQSRPDAYDTVSFRVTISPDGRHHSENLKSTGMPGLYDE